MCVHDFSQHEAAKFKERLGVILDVEDGAILEYWPRRKRWVVIEREGERSAQEARWEFAPSWIKEVPSRPLVNARAESLAEGKPMFREAFAKGRCLLPASGYREYTKRNGEPEQVWFTADDRFYAVAGLKATHPEWGDNCVLVTTMPNALVAEYHVRMPAIVLPESYSAWLDPATPVDDLLDILTPYPSERMSVINAPPKRSAHVDQSLDQPGLFD